MRVLFIIALATIFMGLSSPAYAYDDRPVAFYADHTIRGNGYDYPVEAAVRNWNKNVHVRLVQVENCTEWQPNCVTITENVDQEAGMFWPVYNYIEVNGGDSSNRTWFWKQRRMIICHELGHFLGLRHNGHGCMRAYVLPDTHPYAGDWNRSHVVYPTWST